MQFVDGRLTHGKLDRVHHTSLYKKQFSIEKHRLSEFIIAPHKLIQEVLNASKIQSSSWLGAAASVRNVCSHFSLSCCSWFCLSGLLFSCLLACLLVLIIRLWPVPLWQAAAHDYWSNREPGLSEDTDNLILCPCIHIFQKIGIAMMSFSMLLENLRWKINFPSYTESCG